MENPRCEHSGGGFDNLAQAPGASIGPIRLAPGIPRNEVFIFLAVLGVATIFVSFVNLMQPYVFTEILHIPRDRLGRLAGELMTVQQLVLMLTVGFAGALADRIGRKAMLLFALSGFSLCALLYPLAGGIVGLFVIRVLFGLASSGHTAGGPTKFFDYPAESSRGKFMAMVMVFLAICNVVVVGFLGARLPGWLHDTGASVAQAGTYALWIAAAIGVCATLTGMMFMMRDVPPRTAPRKSMRQGLLGMFSGFGEVLAYARVDRGFGMLLVTAFVIRTDTAVLQSFISLWIITEAARHGVGTIEAVKIAGTVGGIISGMGLIVPPILGPILDRVDRMTMYVIAVGAVGLAFLCALLVQDVTSWQIYALAFVIGFAEMSQVISQQAFFGEAAPAHLRGTAYGLLALLGTFSVVVTSFLAGILFDRVGPTAPFVMTGGLHVGFTVIAILVLWRGARRLRVSAPN